MLAGVRIFENPLLLNDEEVDAPRSFYERWIYPVFIDPFTTPFEPWVKTKKVIKQVPSKKILRIMGNFYVHPAMMPAIRAEMDKVSKEASPVFNWF